MTSISPSLRSSPGLSPPVGGTLVTWTECNTGIFDHGIAPVTQFIEGGFVQKRLNSYAANTAAELERVAA